MTRPSREFDADLLFVYGSLRQGFLLHHHLRRLRAERLGAGRVRAELFSVGQFSGARPSRMLGKTVSGELYRLPAARSALRVLDEVEGFSLRAPQQCVFQRGTAEVALPGGEGRTAWIYWLSRSVHAPRLRAGG